MPTHIKSVLIEYGISHRQLGAALKQADGRPVSDTAVNFLVNYGYFPRSLPEATFKKQIETYLKSKGVLEKHIATLWLPAEAANESDPHAPKCARGAHLREPVPSKAAHAAVPHLPLFDSLEVEMLNPVAKRHFKIFRDPFLDDVTELDDVFQAADQRYVSEAMYHTAKHGGFLAVIGESGSGKTTLRKALIERLRDQSVRLIFPQTFDKSALSTAGICRAIVGDLAPGETMRASLEGQARQVERILVASSSADNSHVLLIEEAHDLSITTLKYLKRFYELENGFKKLLSIILIAQPEMKFKLDESRHPEAREVIRRIEVAELQPLDGHMEDYLRLKFKRLGLELDAVFAPDAFEAIRQRWVRVQPGTRTAVSLLYPLIVNNTVTKCMNKAATLGVPLITADLVRSL